MSKKYENISGGTEKILNAVIEILLPTKIEVTDEMKKKILFEIDDFLNFFPVLFKIGLILGIHLFNILALFVCFRPFTWCSRESKMSYYKSWADSPVFLFRTMVKGIKVLLYIVYYDEREMWEYVGYFPEEWHNERVDNDHKIRIKEEAV